jgi:hypothetical protein
LYRAAGRDGGNFTRGRCAQDVYRKSEIFDAFAGTVIRLQEIFEEQLNSSPFIQGTTFLIPSSNIPER